MKIKTAADANGVAVCNTWDGTTAGSSDIHVQVSAHFAVGQELVAIAVPGGTGATYSDDTVGSSGGSSASGEAPASPPKVLMLELVFNCIIPVYIAVAGGSEGAPNDKPSFTYNVYADAAHLYLIGSAMTPQMNMRDNGVWKAGTTGTACFQPSGLRLWQTNESRDISGSCTA